MNEEQGAGLGRSLSIPWLSILMKGEKWFMTLGSEVTYHWNPAVPGTTFSNQKTESPWLGSQTIGLSAPGPEIISDSSGLIPSKRKFQLFPL